MREEAVPRLVGFGKEELRIQIKQRHRGIDAVDHVEQHNILRAETAGQHEARKEPFDGMGQDLLRRVALKLVAPDLQLLLRRPWNGCGTGHR
jgi:hypothetical protein